MAKTAPLGHLKRVYCEKQKKAKISPRFFVQSYKIICTHTDNADIIHRLLKEIIISLAYPFKLIKEETL
jgi:hypothetical protein